jgi:hypothetical protein
MTEGELGFTPESEYYPTEEIEIEPEIDERFHRIIIKGEVPELKKFILALASEKDHPMDWQMEEIVKNMELFEQDEISQLSDQGSEILEFGPHLLEIGRAEDFGVETANPESLALAYYYKEGPEESEEKQKEHFEEIKETFEKIINGQGGGSSVY